MTIEIISAIGAALVGFVLAGVTAFFQRRQRERVSQLRNEFSERYMTSVTTNYDKLLEKYEEELKPESSTIIKDLRNNTLRDLRNISVHYPVPSRRTEIEAEVNSIINEMNRRIETIETRLPKKATLDKLESVNDAILATQMEALTESVNGLRNNMLTKWDVAKVVFTILGALGVIVGIIVVILNAIPQ